MADSLPPVWPVTNILSLAKAQGPKTPPDLKGNFSGGSLRGVQLTPMDMLKIQWGQLPKILLAWAVWVSTVDMEAASRGYDFSAGGWVSMIVVRDLALMVIVAGGWDWLFYQSQLRSTGMKYKYDEVLPEASQIRRDMFWTTSATLLGSLQEVVLMRWWAGGSFKAAIFGAAPAGETSVPWGDANPFFGPAEDYYLNPFTLGFILWTMSMLYWRIFHFYVIHRCMHPWWDRKNGILQGDLGAVLYRYVHSHHHKSYNPTSWSGISMLPIESVTYISAALIPLMFRSGCHPWIHLYTKLDLIIGAQVGHSGIDEFGGGDYFHELHHAHYECNYGHPAVPTDLFFGTFEDGTSFAASGKDGLEAALLGKKARAAGELREYSMEEVAVHTSKGDAWVVINGRVMDVSDFLGRHPGGEKVLLGKAGTDATAIFKATHGPKRAYGLLKKHLPDGQIGVVPGASVEEEVVEEEDGLGFGADCAQWASAQLLLNGVYVALCAACWQVLMGEF